MVMLPYISQIGRLEFDAIKILMLYNVIFNYFHASIA